MVFAQDAFDQGYAAWVEDKLLKDNPFDPDKAPSEYESWREGWFTACDANSQFGVGA